MERLTISLADIPVVLRIEDAALAARLRTMLLEEPVDHAKAGQQITIDIRECSDLPALPSGESMTDGRGREFVDQEDGTRIFARWAEYGGAYVLHLPERRAEVYVQPDVIARLEFSQLLSALLVFPVQFFPGMQEWFFLHAACVARGSTGLLLLAPSGGGKTTFALSFAERGWALISDDITLLRREGKAFVARSFPRCVRVRRNIVRHLPRLASILDSLPSERGVLPPTLVPIASHLKASIRGIVLLEQADTTPQLIPAASRAVWQRVCAEHHLHAYRFPAARMAYASFFHELATDIPTVICRTAEECVVDAVRMLTSFVAQQEPMYAVRYGSSSL